MTTTSDMPREQPKASSIQGLGAAATGAGAVVLATAASACCVPVLAPLLISVLGVSGAVWAAGLEPYSLAILAVAGLLLAFGFWSVYRPRPVIEGAACPVKRPRAPRAVLWIAAAIWLVAFVLNLMQLIAYGSL